MYMYFYCKEICVSTFQNSELQTKELGWWTKKQERITVLKSAGPTAGNEPALKNMWLEWRKQRHKLDTWSQQMSYSLGVVLLHPVQGELIEVTVSMLCPLQATRSTIDAVNVVQMILTARLRPWKMTKSKWRTVLWTTVRLNSMSMAAAKRRAWTISITRKCEITVFELELNRKLWIWVLVIPRTGKVKKSVHVLPNFVF